MEELLKIAKENYPVGTTFVSVFSGDHYKIKPYSSYEIDDEIDISIGGIIVYSKGIWAKIISKPQVKEVEKERLDLFLEETKTLGTALKDPVNPSHYAGKIECIDAIESALSPEEFRGFLRGNIIKYNWRCMQKNGVEDLKKASWYLDRLIKTLENENPSVAR